jgi:hypothetical protein
MAACSEAKRRQRLRARAKKAAAARAALVASATPTTDGGVELDSKLLLSTGLLGAPQRFVALCSEEGDELLFWRRSLREARVALLRVFPDLTVTVDGDGIHFRWRGGRGGWNLPPAELRGEVYLCRHDRLRIKVPGLTSSCRRAA